MRKPNLLLKMEFNNQNGLILPNEILEMVVKKADAGTTLKLLQSAKVFEHILDEKNWKLLYVFRWHKKILGHSNYNDQGKYVIIIPLNYDIYWGVFCS